MKVEEIGPAIDRVRRAQIVRDDIEWHEAALEGSSLKLVCQPKVTVPYGHGMLEERNILLPFAATEMVLDQLRDRLTQLKAELEAL